MPLLAIDGLSASYGALPILRDIDLTVEKGSVVALIGPSGSGKSTLLRTLVGLTRATAGVVRFADETIRYDSPASLKAARRRMAIVFQQYNLFQNMTALGNVTVAPLQVQHRPRGEVDCEARELLAKVGLADKHAAYPDQLSGGQQQRVAIARALMLKPDLLLLDEVTAALDPELVHEVLDTVRTLAAGGMTMLLVSHEMHFVREIADMVVMMDAGRIVETGPAASIFDAPKADRTSTFMAKVRRA